MNVLGAFLVLQNTMLGPGILGVPWAVAETGHFPGAALFIVSAFMSILGLRLLAKCSLHSLTLPPEASEKQSRLSLGSMARVAGAGKHWEIAVEVANVVACFGAMAASMIGVADQVEHLVSQWISRELAFAIVWLVWVLPMSFVRNLGPLRYSAFACFGVCLYLAVLVPLIVFSGDSIGCPIDDGFGDSGFLPDGGLKISALLKSLPIYTFCFCAHMSMPGAAQDMKDATLRKLEYSILLATSAASVIFGLVAFAGYYGLGSKTPQDLMVALPKCRYVVVARIGLSIVCLCFFPLLLQAVRTTLMSWIVQWFDFMRARSTESREALGHRNTSHEDPMSRGNENGEALNGDSQFVLPAFTVHCCTLVIALAGLAMGMFLTSLGLCCSVAGATGFAIICYIFPGRCYLLMFPNGRARCLAAALLVYGLIMGPACLASNFV